MNRYYEELFTAFTEKEHEMISDLIIRVGRNNESFNLWSASLTEEERSFSVALARKVDDEEYHILEEDEGQELLLFVEILLYYTTYDADLGIELPSVASLYCEAMNAWY